MNGNEKKTKVIKSKSIILDKGFKIKKDKISKRSKSQPLKSLQNKLNIDKLFPNENNNDNKHELKKFNTFKILTNIKKENKSKYKNKNKNKINSINEDADLSYITKKDRTVSFNY